MTTTKVAKGISGDYAGGREPTSLRAEILQRKIKTFRDWLVAETAGDTRRLGRADFEAQARLFFSPSRRLPKPAKPKLALLVEA
jgi:hypothetical protein